MKLYKNLVNAVAQTLQEIFINHRYADKALERLFKQNPQWGSRDRRFVAEGVYEVVRHYRLYAELAESPRNFWFITAVWLVVKGVELPDWQEFTHVNKERIFARLQDARNNLPLLNSYPDWLWELGQAELGAERWQQEAIAMNQQAPVFLRVNTLKTTAGKLIQALAADKTETIQVPGLADALKLVKRENIFQHKLFREGWFEVQDAGSQMIGEFFAPKPGELVIDACAGAGGKSLHLAALMRNKGKVISMDVEAWKLEELKKRARRAGAFNIETRVIEAGTITKFGNSADRLLLDVPCSGLGVLKRNPDAKWKLSPELIEKTKKIQSEVLEQYPGMLKPGGLLVYSTCSILPSENEGQVKAFLVKKPDFTLLKEKMVYPSEGADGFYMAMMRREA